MPQRAKALLQRIKVKIHALSQRDTSNSQKSIFSHGKSSDVSRGSSQLPDSHQKDPSPANGAARSNSESGTAEKGIVRDNDPGTTKELDERHHATPETSQGAGSLDGQPVTTNKSDIPMQIPLFMDEEGESLFDQWSDYTTESFGKAGKAPERASVPGINLENSVDMDRDMSYRSAVMHETVRPQVHQIVQEQIHRDVHTYDHYHYIQPIRDLEVLPARHFIPNAEGQLVEVAEEDVPGFTGSNHKWSISNDGCVVDNPHNEKTGLVAGKS